MIEKFQRAYENLKKIADKRQEEIDRLREELDEYKKRHPATVGVCKRIYYLQHEDARGGKYSMAFSGYLSMAKNG